MENSIYIALSRQISLAERMNLLSNNIANVNTVGFRSEHMIANEEVIRQDVLREDLSFVLDRGQYKNLAPGPIEVTGNDLDVALEGPGFFGVAVNDQVRYTRAGNFQLNNNREIVNAAGQHILDDGGSPITINEDVKEIYISSKGTVIGNDEPIAQLMIAEFDNVQDMEPIGNNMYATDQQRAEPTRTRTIQGSLERSNVNGVLEMTNMIDVSRQYQSNARILQNEHDRLRQAIRTLSEVQA